MSEALSSQGEGVCHPEMRWEGAVMEPQCQGLGPSNHSSVGTKRGLGRLALGPGQKQGLNSSQVCSAQKALCEGSLSQSVDRGTPALRITGDVSKSMGTQTSKSQSQGRALASIWGTNLQVTLMHNKV